MAGVRVTHATERNVRYTVVEGDRPYPGGPYVCSPPEFGGCAGTHIFKTHHLNVDNEGSVIVGDVLYQKIKHLLYANGFRESNIVVKPPAITLGVGVATPGSGAWGNIPIVRGKGDNDG